MSIAASSRIGNEMCYIHICVDAYDDGDIRGRIFNASLSEPVYFYSAVELLKDMENIFNELDYPHAGMNIRSFENRILEDYVSRGPSGTVKKAPSQAQIKRFTVRGKEATFRTRVMFRQNASWQGAINWLERDQVEEFKSCLEFLELIDSAFGEDE